MLTVKIRNYIRTTLAILLVSSVLFPSFTIAADLNNRSIALLSSEAGIATDHLFSFDFSLTSNVGSIVFAYCDNSPVQNTPCVQPPGLDVMNANLSFQTGEVGFSKSVAETSQNRFVISRASVAATTGNAQYLIGGAINPSSANETVYVRISTHAANDGSGPVIENGAVAFSTASRITASAYVPPYLLFCVAVVVSLDCTSTIGNFINLGELSTNFSSTATSQYSGATNDPSGYAVTVYGTTLTAGNNIIPALVTKSTSTPGVSQFGINLRDNSSPDVGIEPIGPGTSVVVSEYASPNLFKYISGEIVSNVSMTTSYRRMTVSYMVNVDDNQAPGVYSSTFTYIATASF